MDQTTTEPALTRDWFSLSRLEQIAKRHELWNSCGLPNDEYTASWYDVKVLLDRIRELDQTAPSEARIFCSSCEASLTQADFDAGYCTNCGWVIDDGKPERERLK